MQDLPDGWTWERFQVVDVSSLDLEFQGDVGAEAFGILNLKKATSMTRFTLSTPLLLRDVLVDLVPESSRRAPIGHSARLGEVEGLGFRPETLSPSSPLAPARSFALPDAPPSNPTVSSGWSFHATR